MKQINKNLAVGKFVAILTYLYVAACCWGAPCPPAAVSGCTLVSHVDGNGNWGPWVDTGNQVTLSTAGSCLYTDSTGTHQGVDELCMQAEVYTETYDSLIDYQFTPDGTVQCPNCPSNGTCTQHNTQTHNTPIPGTQTVCSLTCSPVGAA